MFATQRSRVVKTLGAQAGWYSEDCRTIRKVARPGAERRYMSPEALSSEVYPASDVWAAGVMAYQLLCGFLPFDDVRNRDAPALSQACAAISTETP